MHIKKLEIYGFKSFPYKVILPFTKGITAIVGPNGSGKSNILDAIKWVLGEQSTKRLRIKEIADLIYSGNSDKKIDFAEVKLVLSHDPPVFEKYKDFEEIHIIRRFYRDGEGEFYINNKPCRLKDIHFLFLDLGVNPQSYGIIDQGEVNRFLEVSSKERKRYLEDLAGISKLKVTEEEIEKNLFLAKQNLQRINDVIKEVENQYFHLRRQAEEAKKYLAIKEELRKLSLIRVNILIEREKNKRLELNRLKEEKLIEKQKAENLLNEIEEKEKKVLNKIIIKERKVKDLKKEREKINNELSKIIHTLEELYREESNYLNRIEREKIRMEAEEEKKKKYLEEMEKKEKILLSLTEREKETETKLQERKKTLETIYIEYEKILKEYKEHKSKQDEIKNKCLQLSEKLKFLRREKESQEKEFDLIKREMENSQKALVNLNMEKEFLCKILTKTSEDKAVYEKILENLRSEESELKNRKNTIKEEINKIITEIKNKEENINLINSILEEEKKAIPRDYQMKTLGENLKLSIDEINILEYYYGDFLKAVLVENYEEIEKIYNFTGYSLYFLMDYFNKLNTKVHIKEKLIEEGNDESTFEFFLDKNLLKTPQGFVLYVKKEKKGYFTLRKEKEIIEKDLQILKERLKGLCDEEKEVEKEIQKRTNKIKEIIELIRGKERELNNLNSNLTKIEKQIIRIDENNKNLENKLSKIRNKINEFQREIEEIEREMKNLEKIRMEKDRKILELRDILKTYEEKRNSILQEINIFERETIQLKTEIRQIINRKNEIQKEIERINKFLRETQFKCEALIEEKNYIKSKLREFLDKKKAYEETKKIIQLQIEELERSLEIELDERKEITNKRKEIEKRLTMIEKEIYNLDIKLTENKLTLESLDRELKDLIGENHFQVPLKDMDYDINSLEKKIDILKEEIKKYGEVNLASIKEFEMISERYEKLKSQKEDIENTIKEILKILEDLKAKALDKLVTTLAEVNLQLKKIFPLIFENSSAELYFTEEDPLRAGLDLRIEFPHKNIRHLNMLSGGEKALCVIALLIAFYLTKPGPFCILDEIDAPLDEKNSLKFIKLLKKLKENSQIILISHNPNVIKEVDNIIGVTMEEKGVSKVVQIRLRD